jgi:hypothetical protein
MNLYTTERLELLKYRQFQKGGVQMHDKPQRKILFFIGAIAAALILCCVAVALLPKEPVQLPSDSPGIEFVMEEDRVTCIEIRGQFPYLRIICPLGYDEVQDEANHVVEKIYTYTMQAEPAFFGQSMTSMKLNVEVSDEVICTYILKFADKDVKIVNGKVVE